MIMILSLQDEKVRNPKSLSLLIIETCDVIGRIEAYASQDPNPRVPPPLKARVNFKAVKRLDLPSLATLVVLPSEATFFFFFFFSSFSSIHPHILPFHFVVLNVIVVEREGEKDKDSVVARSAVHHDCGWQARVPNKPHYKLRSSSQDTSTFLSTFFIPIFEEEKQHHRVTVLEASWVTPMALRAGFHHPHLLLGDRKDPNRNRNRNHSLNHNLNPKELSMRQT